MATSLSSRLQNLVSGFLDCCQLLRQHRGWIRLGNLVISCLHRYIHWYVCLVMTYIDGIVCMGGGRSFSIDVFPANPSNSSWPFCKDGLLRPWYGSRYPRELLQSERLPGHHLRARALGFIHGVGSSQGSGLSHTTLRLTGYPGFYHPAPVNSTESSQLWDEYIIAAP